MPSDQQLDECSFETLGQRCLDRTAERAEDDRSSCRFSWLAESFCARQGCAAAQGSRRECGVHIRLWRDDRTQIAWRQRRVSTSNTMCPQWGQSIRRGHMRHMKRHTTLLVRVLETYRYVKLENQLPRVGSAGKLQMLVRFARQTSPWHLPLPRISSSGSGWFHDTCHSSTKR
jgi:hypothetical protein